MHIAPTGYVLKEHHIISRNGKRNYLFVVYRCITIIGRMHGQLQIVRTLFLRSHELHFSVSQRSERYTIHLARALLIRIYTPAISLVYNTSHIHRRCSRNRRSWRHTRYRKIHFINSSNDVFFLVPHLRSIPIENKIFVTGSIVDIWTFVSRCSVEINFCIFSIYSRCRVSKIFSYVTQTATATTGL